MAQQLLAEAYAAARDRGLPHAGLSTDTRTGALDLYLRLGMRVLFSLDNYELDLSGAGRPPAERACRTAVPPRSIRADRVRRLSWPVGALCGTMHSPSCYGGVP